MRMIEIVRKDNLCKVKRFLSGNYAKEDLFQRIKLPRGRVIDHDSTDYKMWQGSLPHKNEVQRSIFFKEKMIIRVCFVIFLGLETVLTFFYC